MPSASNLHFTVNIQEISPRGTVPLRHPCLLVLRAERAVRDANVFEDGPFRQTREQLAATC